ncbi:peptidase S41 [Seonamhaeicola algicola]|uniref:Peptidase S41 n=1 Tax=Seonamhaeicola algicola TaxID=1719036 RepID=A0A5C7B049_9FLAO|nr:S41 family peptidase [Seonamhaeicola algicola]TXE13817.1 peptidase S41 [Seonamhaeicola algicola]
MRKTIFIILLLICGNNLFSQKKLSETEKLESVAKVWGFLKYYHPEIANGKYNWDEELFTILPKVHSCDNIEQLSELYIKWIDKFGKVRKCKKCQKTKEYDYFNKNFNLKWINNEDLFTKELSDKLRHIEINRHQGNKHYVTVASKRIGNIEVTNEIEYKDFDWQNENLRLLTLFRYWNIIEYFFPYKYQTDTNWDKVLQEMIPKFSNPKNEIDFHLAMLELIVKVDDSHASFVTDKTNTFFGYHWIPAKFKLIDGKAIITGFYNDSLAKYDDLRVGDIITTINNQKVETIFNQNKKYIYGSNMSRKKGNSYYSIFNGSSDSVRIEFIRNNQTKTKTIKRYKFKEFNYKWKKENDKFKILDGNIGYVNMGTIKIKEVPNIMDSLMATKAIIFDVRNYPKGTLYSISNYLTSTQRDFYKVTYPDLDYPGKFIWRDGRRCGKNGELKYKGKVILLVNEKSQSHAEFTAMCLQTGDNVTTIGSQTSGADGNVSKFNMVGGYKTKISGIGIFYPDKTEAQRKGVKVDVEIEPTIQGIIQGKDEVLEKAIEFIDD